MFALNNKKTITLFDMDGTLTEPRQVFDRDLLPVLYKLSEISDIGIVSGSDHEYIFEQMQFLLQKTSMRYQIHLYLLCQHTAMKTNLIITIF